MRLIDADALEKILKEKGDDYKVSMFATADDCNIVRLVAFECAEAVKNAPTIETEPVQHGRWIRDDLGRACCSVCEKPIPFVEEYDTDEDCGGTYEVEIDETPYCPNCGAKMDLEG